MSSEYERHEMIKICSFYLYLLCIPMPQVVLHSDHGCHSEYSQPENTVNFSSDTLEIKMNMNLYRSFYLLQAFLMMLSCS